MATRRTPPWLLLTVVCVGQFMVVLDVSIVNVALPAMKANLHFSATNLQWVVNAYALSFGGFLMLGGRAGDLFGRKRMFLVGLGLFVGASLVCALATDQALLIGARILQGLGGAVLAPATLTLLTTAFPEPRERARVLGVWSAMAAAGGASGVVLGGFLTDLLSWRWIFLINVPIGVTTFLVARMVLRESKGEVARRHLDALGAITVTAGLVVLAYTFVGTATHPWGSAVTIGGMALAVALLAAFVIVESLPGRVPLVPFRIFASKALSGANVAMLMLGAAIFPMWLFLSLYMQDVLHFSPMRAGFGFLPQTLAIMVGAQVSSRVVPRLGPRVPLVAGSLCSALGLLWLSRVGVGDSYWTVAFAGGTLAALGLGLAMTPMAYAATNGVAPHEAGLASGVLNTSRQIGGALGLAILVTLAASHTNALLAGHVGPTTAATAGYGRAFLVAAAAALAACVAGFVIPAAGPPAAGPPAGAAEPAKAAGATGATSRVVVVTEEAAGAGESVR